MKKLYLLFLTAIVMTLFLSSCSQPVVKLKESPVGLTDKNTKTQMNSVRVIDGNLIKQDEKKFLGRIGPSYKKVETKIVIEKQVLAMTATGLKEVIVSIRNQTDNALQVEGSVNWFDSSEIPLSQGETGWQRIFIPAKSTRAFRQNAMSPAAEYYVVDIKEGE
ncbi:MAG: DUF1425 domain-containing protein [Pseudomonadales bacterium]|nr:DUF1425 domain-containing protein [Pseudomonadales bacterium]